MARMRPRKIFWNLPDGASHANIYMAKVGLPDFLQKADAGELPVLARIPNTAPQQLIITTLVVDPDDYQFCVVAESEAEGKFSDPYQPEVWKSVPLDVTPLPPPSGGGLSLV